MTNRIFTKFIARVTVEGVASSDAQIFQPLALLEHSLRLALLSSTPEMVAEMVSKTTKSMVHSLSCKRRQGGEVVHLTDEDPEGYNGLYQIADGRGKPMICLVCGNPACTEWPTLIKLTKDGSLTEEYAYHVSECQMNDKP